MIHYRPAQITDAAIVSELLLEVSFASRFLYGTTYKEEEIAGKIIDSFIKEDGKSSYKNFYVAEATVNDNKKVIGFVAFYDYSLHKIDEKMQAAFNKDSLKVLEPLFHSILPNSLYISALIVEGNFRNLNIGPQLINHVREQALKQNRSHVCLHVWEDNQKGIKFYLKNNFTLHEDMTFVTNSTLLPPSKKIYLAGLSVM